MARGRKKKERVTVDGQRVDLLQLPSKGYSYPKDIEILLEDYFLLILKIKLK